MYFIFCKLHFLTQQWFALMTALISDHLTCTLPTSSTPKINQQFAHSCHWRLGYFLNHPAAQIATSRAQSCVFMQLESMPRLLRKQTDILTCFHDLFCLLLNAVCITTQLSPPFIRKSLQLHREKHKSPPEIRFRKLPMKLDVLLAKATVRFTLIAQYLCQMKITP